MTWRARKPLQQGSKKAGKRRLSWGSGLWGLTQDKSRKVRHGWGGRFFRVFHKVILSLQGLRQPDFPVFNMLAQGAARHGPR